VINLASAPAIGGPRGATFIKLEPDCVTWPDIGVNVQIMQPGQSTGRYHWEPVQEDFLVLSGECIAIVDDEERRLRQWDFSIVRPGASTSSWEPGKALAPC
jgi:mannose-6-phosphate isomerase-like protein (cupin superfamily)